VVDAESKRLKRNIRRVKDFKVKWLNLTVENVTKLSEKSSRR